MARILAWLQAALLSANGLAMLFAGGWWYGVVPGVTVTGPYNPHFVRDIGAAYLVAGPSHAAFALRPRPWRGSRRVRWTPSDGCLSDPAARSVGEGAAQV